MAEQGAALGAAVRPGQPVAVGGRSPWRLARQRLRRDRVAMASAILLGLVLFGVTLGGPLAERLLGHGPNDPFPYAVDFYAKPVGPWTHVPDINSSPAAPSGSCRRRLRRRGRRC